MRGHPNASYDEGQRRRYALGRDGIRRHPWRPGIRKPAEFDFPPLPMEISTRLQILLVALCAAYFIWQIVRSMWMHAL